MGVCEIYGSYEIYGAYNPLPLPLRDVIYGWPLSIGLKQKCANLEFWLVLHNHFVWNQFKKVHMAKLITGQSIVKGARYHDFSRKYERGLSCDLFT